MNLPTILSGPILRRVEKKAIYIWIALSKKRQLGAKVYSIQAKHTTKEHTYELISDQSETQTFRLGKNLYIYLIKILPHTETFPSQTLLGYNIEFKKGNTVCDLGDFQLLSSNSPTSICYGNLQYPSFFIPDSNKQNLLYGSCRKLHGIGRDALGLGDDKLQEYHLNFKKRPGALFMTGDQIYADDVPAPIAPFFTKLGNQLIGRKEQLTSLCEELKNAPFQIAINQINGRKDIIKKYCQFTSRKGDNHLLTLGEYAAMYTMSWSPEILELAINEQHLKTFEDHLSNEEIYIETETYQQKEYEKKISRLKRTYSQQWKEVAAFYQSIPKVRRLLANIPTYMIFDDHDITDDWNITEEWQQKVGSSPLGNHVIANALTAYWAFQGWGNDPSAFPPSFLNKIWNYVKRLKVNTPDYKEWIHLLLNFNSWNYIAPTAPQSLVLDTRTQRAYPADRTFVVGNLLKQQTNGPNLIRRKEWDNISELLSASGWQSNTPLLIVSATPLYGVHLIESFLKNYIMPITNIVPSLQEKLDLEWWKFNGRGVSFFHQQIAKWNPSECIILSGDAHMAFSIQTEVFLLKEKKRTIHQFTSSPIKNQSFNGLAEIALKGFLQIRNYRTKKHLFSRYCGEDYMVHTKETPAACLWKETISHQVLQNGSIIDTKNNLGWLSFDEHGFRNTFLRK
ncbi:hypothetical protein [Niallia sp. NCCP-28]|uniref:hypothetical protein n=1 Tax=Niallia sp. NCCP-28 TaxID=2934712 RepID=UPI00207FB951|nr:hypothetical protein [Niallia sp. NCCP-28]GKU82181.1 hypothetical protein NCCP28_15770 [Niallia sp. NCCP-28]